MFNEIRVFEELEAEELIPDSPYESRYEFVRELAYKLWAHRGCPFGSPDIDWFAAEETVYRALVASGMIFPSPDNQQNLGAAIYH